MALKVEHIHQRLEEILNNTKTHALKVKLIAFSAVCEELVKKKAELTIANVVAQLTNNKVKISSRTIYNDREGGNPYREIFNLWLEYSKASASDIKVRINSDVPDILSTEDIRAITDPVIKYRVNLLYAETLALRNQNRMLREIRNMPSIQAMPASRYATDNAPQLDEILLDPYEIELLKSFIKGTADLAFDENGGLIIKRNLRANHRVMPSGFKGAIAKLISKFYSKS